MRGLLIAGAAVLLVACGGGAREKQEAEARAVMIPVVTGIVADAYPDLFAITPVAECIVDNATPEEQFILVESALQGVSGRVNAMVIGMAQRPETQTCIASHGVTL